MKTESPIKLFLFFLILIFLADVQAQTWTNNGPFGGYITTMVINPIDTNIVYVATYGAGIFRSNNGGDNWIAINKGFPFWPDSNIGSPTEPSWWFGNYFPVTTVKIFPDNPEHLIAGTHGAGIAQSYDGGQNWAITNTGLPDSTIVRVLWKHPKDVEFLLCGTGYSSGGLYRSLDGGQTWALVDNVPNGSSYYITTITHDPIHPDTLYVGFSSTGEPEISWGLMRSTNKGNTLEMLNQFYSFFDLQVNPYNSLDMWSVIHTGFLEWMLFYSEDGGRTWQPYPDNNPWKGILTMYADHNWNLYVIDEDANNFVIRKSIDGGQSWSVIPFSLPSVPMGILPGNGPNIADNPLNPQTIYFGTRVAVYRSDDGGQSFNVKDEGMINTYINEIAVNSQNPLIVYAGSNQGFWKSTDGGNRWIRLSTSNVNAVAIDPQHPDTLYWGGEDLMRSYDGGNTLEVILPNRIITDIEIHPDSTNKLFVGLYPSTLYMTETWGDNWNVSYTPPHGSFWIEDIAIFKQNPQLMYFGTGRNVLNHGLFKSIDGGLSWIKISDPGQIVSIALHPTSPETVFVASYVKIQVSYNGGTSFEEVGQSIPSNDISKIIVNLNNPSKLIVGTKDKGVFYTLNSGQSWKPASGLYDPRVTDIHLILTMKSIFIGAHGSGIWQGYDVVSNIDRKNNPIDAHQVFSFLPTYPNPFNTQTTISFDLSERKEIELNIYNLQGQLIKKLVKNTFLAGKHQIQWNGTDEQNRPVVNGIYFIRLHSNTQDATAKLILLK